MEHDNTKLKNCCSHNHSDENNSHSHGHHGGHHHHHHHHRSDLKGKKLLWVTLLNFTITLVEILGGIFSNSLSLLSDAVHNLGDTSAIFFAYIADRISKKKADKRLTYGYKRAEILTAFFNALILVIICVFLFKEAYDRFVNPEPIKGALMLIVAVIGLVANWISVLVLKDEKDKNINIRAAYLHLLGDTLSSVAVIIGGIFIWRFNIIWIDPLITVLVSIYIIWHTWGILKESLNILMQSSPEGLNIIEIKEEIEKLPEVKDVHHMHAWRLNEEQLHFEAHIMLNENIDMKAVSLIKEHIENILHKNGITHTTLQFDYENCNGNSECWISEKE